MLRSRLALAVVSIAAVGCALACAGSSPTGSAAPGAAARPAMSVSAAPPAAELVETAPIETTLDTPGQRTCADIWLEMIAAARSSIDLGQFYASNQQPSRLEPIVEALEAAVARGVRVRFLAEKSFVKVYPDTLDRLAGAGAKIRHFDLRTAPGGRGVLHAKYFIVDDRDAFFGSQNFDWRALEHNYELGMRVRSPAFVAGLAAIFAADWARAGGEPVDATGSTDGANGAARRGLDHPAAAAHDPITLVASPRDLGPPGVPWDLPRIIELLDSATTTITVQALGYRADADGGPWLELEAPLLRAAARGVSVRLLFADWAKRPRSIAGLQKLARIPHIEVRLTTIPVWSGGFIPFARVTHGKALVVDGKRAWLGTSNWEKDYFYNSRNVGAIIDEPTLAGALAARFAAVWQSPYAIPVDPDAAYSPPRIE